MVQIPRLNEQVRLRGRNQQNRTTQTSGAQLDGGMGEALQNLGKGIMDVALAKDFRDGLHAEADARKGLGKLRDAERAIMRDPETGYLLQQGGNALGEARDQTVESFEDARERIAGTLSPRARKLFEVEADKLGTRVKDLTINHEGVQLKNYTNAELAASAQDLVDSAVSNHTREDLFQEDVNGAVAEVRRLAALNGDGPEATEDKIEGVLDAAHSGRVVALANDDPVAAWDYLQANKDKIGTDNWQKLHDQLRPAWVAQRARNWVGEQNVDVENNRFTRLGIPKFIYTPESGGDVNAQNPNGSAGGVVQFTKGTYLDLVKQMQKDGAAAWSVGMSDQQILETRFGEENLEKVAEVYRTFRRNNQNALNGAGVPITPRTEYMAHHFGAQGAIDLWQAALSGETSKSLKQHLIETKGEQTQKQWFAQNAWMKGKTVGGAMDWFSRKTQTENVVAPGIAMAEAAAIEDPELRAAVMQELQLRMEAEDMAKTAQQKQANEEAWKQYEQTGDVTEISEDVLQRAGFGTRNAIREQQQKDMRGIDTTVPATYDEIDEIAYEDPDEFMKMDLSERRSELSSGDYATLLELQREMKADRDKIAAQGRSAIVYPADDREADLKTLKDQFKREMGEDLTRWPDFQQQMRGRMRRFADKEGRPPEPSELQRMMDALMIPAIIEGDPGPRNLLGNLKAGERRFFDTARVRRDNAPVELQAGIMDVGPREIARIESEFEARWDRPPTDDEIVEQFENELLDSFGIDPQIEFREIESDIRKQLIVDFPGQTQEQYAEIYKALVIDAARLEEMQEKARQQADERFNIETTTSSGNFPGPRRIQE